VHFNQHVEGKEGSGAGSSWRLHHLDGTVLELNGLANAFHISG
jgi:hypothetical protein